MTPKYPKYFVPVRALSVIFRAKMRQAFKREHLLQPTPTKTWTQPWVVHCQHAGSGEKVLGYLARYAFRVAITNSRLESFVNGHVTFRYRDNRTQQEKHLTLCAEEFIARFMQHILPRGFPKVRYYGLAAASYSKAREQARALMQSHIGTKPNYTAAAPSCPRRQSRHAAALSPLPRRTFDRSANPPPAKKVSSIMLPTPFHRRLSRHSLSPDQTRTLLAAAIRQNHSGGACHTMTLRASRHQHHSRRHLNVDLASIPPT